MEVEYKYDRTKDIECLLTKGKGSFNSSHATKAYEELVAFKGENPTEQDTDLFVTKYLSDNTILIQIYGLRSFRRSGLGYLESIKKELKLFLE